MTYFVLFFMFATFAVLDLTTVSRLQKGMIFLLELVILVTLGTIRWKTGTDWVPYATYFVDYDTWQQFNTGAFESGWALLNFLVKQVTDNYTGFLLVLTALSVFIKAYTIKQNSHYLLITLLAYLCFFLGDIFAVRQTLAVSFCVLGINFIIKRQPFLFLLCVFLAANIHNTAAIFIFAYWLFYARVSNTVIIGLMIVAIAVGVSGILSSLLAPFNFLFEAIGGDTGNRMSTKLGIYAKGTDLSNSLSKGTVLLIGILRRSFFIPVYLLMRRQCEAADKRYTGFLNLFIFGNLVYFVFASSLLVFVRATIYFIVSEIFLLSILVMAIRSPKIKIVVFSLVVLYCGLKMYYNLNAYWELLVPFHTIFDTNIDRTLY